MRKDAGDTILGTIATVEEDYGANQNYLRLAAQCRSLVKCLVVGDKCKYS
jgi:hypothetical protein